MRTTVTAICDLQIHSVETGDGPLVLFLHGFPEFWYSWRKILEPVAEAGFRAVAVDLPGYNESSKPGHVDAYRIRSLADDIAAFIIAINGGRPCVVVGHDWGGFIAWYLAMLHPELVSRLVILNVPHPVPYSRVLHRSLEQKLRSAYQLFFQLPIIPEIVLRIALPRMMKRMGRFTSAEVGRYREAWRKPHALTSMLNYYRALRRSGGELKTALRRIDQPVLLIWGEGEPVFMRETTENFGEWVPNLRIERIAKAGHFVQTDAPQEVVDLIRRFAEEGRAAVNPALG